MTLLQRSDRTTKRLTGIVCALLVVALFSGFTLVSRMGRAVEFSPLDLAALRFAIGGLVLAPVVLRHGLSGLSWPQAAAMAGLGGLGFALSAYGGFALAPAAHGAVLLHGTLPLSTFLIVLLVDPTQARPGMLRGLALIALGVAAMAWDSRVAVDPAQLAGDGFLLLASLLWSGYGLLFRRLGLAPLRAAAIVAVFSMLCFLPPYVATQGASLLNHAWRDLLIQGAFQGLLIGAVSIFVYSQAVAYLGAIETALFTAAVPAVTTLAAIPLLSEWPTPAACAGVGLATTGMVLAIRAAP